MEYKLYVDYKSNDMLRNSFYEFTQKFLAFHLENGMTVASGVTAISVIHCLTAIKWFLIYQYQR